MIRSKTLAAAALVAALCGSLTACGGGEGLRESESTSSASVVDQETVEPTDDEGRCKEAMRPYIKDSYEEGVFGSGEAQEPPADIVAQCLTMDDTKIRELGLDILEEEYGEDVSEEVRKRLEEQPAQDEYGMWDATKDVKIKSCKLADPYELGDSLPYADISIKAEALPGHEDEALHYEYEVEVLDAKGNRVEVLSSAAEDVRPGTTVDTRDGDEDAYSSSDNNVYGKITCELISAKKDLAGEYA